MVDYKRRPQYSKPFLITRLDDSANGRELDRLTFAPGAQAAQDLYDERWLQKLLHRYPRSLPINELEPGIGSIIPIGLELPTPAGFVDNIFVSTQGGIVLLECKLWRNPEARRRVIGQVIDYAQSLAGWNYEKLDAAVRKSVDVDDHVLGRPLLDIIRAADHGDEDFEEASFVDAIQRNLRMGRMLLLVVGDGIREDVESLAEYLQKHAGFHFNLGLVEVAIYRLPHDGLIVQPRVLARTLNIERAIVKLASADLRAEPVPATTESATAQSMSLTDEVFFEKLAVASTDTANQLKAFLDLAKDDHVYLSPAGKSASLRWESASGNAFNLGAIDLQAKLQTYAVGWVPERIGHVDLGHQYLEQLAALVGGSVRQTKTASQWWIVTSGTTPPAALDALRKPAEWLAVIRDYQARLNAVEQITPQ